MFQKDLKLIFSDRKMLILLVLLIFICTAGVFFCVSETREPALTMGIADQDQTEESGLLVTYFDENEVFSSYFKVVRGTEEELEEKFNNGEIDMYLVIPPDFTEQLTSIINLPIKTYINIADKTKAVLLTNLADSYANYITAVEMNCQGLTDILEEEGFEGRIVNDQNLSISYELVFTALGKDEFFKRKNIERFEGISLINYYVYSLMILLILYGGLFAGLKSLKERLGQAGHRLMSVGVSKSSIFASSLFAFVLVYSVIMVISVILINSFGNLDIPVSATLFILLAIVFSCVLFMLISGFTKSVATYMILGNMLILFTTIAGGGIIPIMYLPEGCAVVARFTPTYWFIKLIL